MDYFGCNFPNNNLSFRPLACDVWKIVVIHKLDVILYDRKQKYDDRIRKLILLSDIGPTNHFR